MQRLRIKHLTEYLFPTQVTLNPHRLLLRPREGHDVRIETSRLEITPATTSNGNAMCMITPWRSLIFWSAPIS